ncbi:hypothetical protein IVB27_38575 [Bradyrhizobium sp. 197]|uniref:hypothetical protein n=1 Tax=Bradyrhizobium sp. 197 TaxID=2782663 RepID=UPI001FF73A87|nr:hypothetical protein [Bradyrhizobium sp. 197]MCK1480485.1 hypothetical protein [Bradyrhizobium sp. 197]
MSRVERVKEYANPSCREHWNGEATTKNLARWSERASANSAKAPRASKGEMKLPETDNIALHDTASKPRTTAEIDKRMVGKDDLNSDGGSSFMPGVRRKA